MSCSEKYVAYMHEYLDEEISIEHERELKEHLLKCPECQKHFHELEKSLALVKSIAHVTTPDDFTLNVMNRLPKEKKKVGFQRWLRHHPLLTAASLFLVLMVGSLFSSWNTGHDLSVSKQPNLIVKNDTVIVPEGEVVKGDVVVRNGSLRIDGQIDGNVTVINGTVINGDKYLASAGDVTGEIKEINAIFEWVWYHLKNMAKEAINFFEESEQSQAVTVSGY
ncbi:anti-sigma factor [Robertmurraya sp. DFI.2.37]|uniref:anti-sigma factor family protein n=1 Tax=Robertmurraya sp. DFI.2.37 TaxID=3031819 RepID=UPI001247E44A|nr:anti-sigma factor [Robertmurraya sp. DFI.2.37]MDF1511397.1 anti-sigma factor [Robertmurraya sp. DFI.2.37]